MLHRGSDTQDFWPVPTSIRSANQFCCCGSAALPLYKVVMTIWTAPMIPLDLLHL